MITKEWFTVSREGLAELQAGKPKSYILRELIQNAWDENTSICKVEIKLIEDAILHNPQDYEVVISVEDDSEKGFRDLSDGYTLFKKSYKRKEANKRGRFNIGEKQAFSICERAIIETTKGTLLFDKEGRTLNSDKNSCRKSGTKVTVIVKMSEEEFDKMLSDIKLYLTPKNIKFIVNGKVIDYIKPFKTFEAKLLTEIEEDNIFKRRDRITKVELLEPTLKTDCNTTLYEMGIPVMEIDCDYSINIQQKIPLSIDRETVLPSFLRDLYSEVLNNTYQNISEEKSSQVWIREAMSDERVNKEAVSDIITKRYGDNVCVADPFDKNSIDEAISKGYRVIRGNE